MLTDMHICPVIELDRFWRQCQKGRSTKIGGKCQMKKKRRTNFGDLKILNVSVIPLPSQPLYEIQYQPRAAKYKPSQQISIFFFSFDMYIQQIKRSHKLYKVIEGLNYIFRESWNSCSSSSSQIKFLCIIEKMKIFPFVNVQSVADSFIFLVADQASQSCKGQLTITHALVGFAIPFQLIERHTTGNQGHTCLTDILANRGSNLGL